jgi:hypothetical protein
MLHQAISKEAKQDKLDIEYSIKNITKTIDELANNARYFSDQIDQLKKQQDKFVDFQKTIDRRIDVIGRRIAMSKQLKIMD